jgi:hypothetical protein
LWPSFPDSNLNDVCMLLFKQADLFLLF